MGVVTELTLQKDKSRANVFIDGEFVCGVDLGTLVKYGVKVGTEITEKKLEEIQNEGDFQKAYEKALSLVERQKYTARALKAKLAQKEYSNETIQKVVDKLTEYNFISDKDFAESYVRSTKNKSKKELENALIQKGISQFIIDEVLSQTETSDDEIAASLAEKFMKNKEASKENIKKLLAYLYRKGFSFSMCLDIAKKYGEDEI